MRYDFCSIYSKKIGMKKLLLFLILNIISFVASFSAMGTGTFFGYFVALACWAIIILYVLAPSRKQKKA